MRQILFFCFLVFALQVWAQEVPPGTGPEEELLPEEAQQQAWTKAFQEAEKVFNSENQADCIPLFQDLISRITEEKAKRSLTEPERLMLLKSLDYLGQTFFLEGQQEESQRVFLKLIELEPNYQLNEDLVSSKIIAFVRQIRSQNLGILLLTSDPPGAAVTLDGNEIGTTDLKETYALKGDHDVEVTKPGYFPQKKTITVVAGKTERISFALERSSSVAYFISYPKGVEVYMNGNRIGITGGEPAERAQQKAVEQSLPVTDFSAEFPVADLHTGEYLIEFRKPCWETPPRKITITENKDYLFEPILMVPSIAIVNLTANDPQANIFIDDEYKGIAPKQRIQVCSGKHTVKVKGPMGKYETQIELKKDEVLNLSAKLNPSLAFLGVVRSGDSSTAAANRLAAETIRRFSTLQKLNFQDNTEAANEAGGEDTLRQILDSIDDGKSDPNRTTKIQDLCHRVESDLLLIARLTGGRAQDSAQLYLLSSWSSMADTRTVSISDSTRWDQLKAQLDYEEPLFVSRPGIHLIDTTITSGPVIAQIPMKTFEDSEPIQIGDTLVSLQGNPVANASEFYSAIQNLPPKVAITLQRSGTSLVMTIKTITSPVEVPLDNPDLLFNRQLVTFKKAFNYPNADALQKNIALLNIGLCHIHFGEYEQALDQFRQIQMDRDQGIGPGTVRYRMAQCYLELGSIREAQENLAAASRYSNNTIEFDDGLPLAREIERMQKALQ